MAIKKDTKTGKWFYYGKHTDLFGNIKQYKKRGFRTSREAKHGEQLFLMCNKESGSNLTLNEIYEEFIIYSKPRKKQTTINKDKQMYRLHIKDYFGEKDISKITVKEVLKWQTFLIEEKKLTPVNINSIMKSFNKYFMYSSKVYLTNNNPVRLAGRLKEQKRDYTIWSEDDFNSFYSVLEDEKDKLAFRLLYYTGICRGEFLALLWSDFDGNSINISKTCAHTLGGYLITEPKTNNSYRKVELDNITKKMLKNYKNKLSDIDCFSNSWYIFGSVNSMPFNTLGRIKDKYIPLAKVPKIRVHDLRHSHVSLLINNNIPLPAVASRVGDTIDTVLKTYTHLFDKSSQELIDFLNKC